MAFWDFVRSVLWITLPAHSSASTAANSDLRGCSRGTYQLSPCNVFLSKIFFQLIRSKQLMVSCDLLDLHFSFSYATVELPLLALL